MLTRFPFLFLANLWVSLCLGLVRKRQRYENEAASTMSLDVRACEVQTWASSQTPPKPAAESPGLFSSALQSVVTKLPYINCGS